MAIGRDVYLDSRMIIHRLEERFPASEQHPAFSTKETAGVAALLNKLSVDASFFAHAVGIMPPEAPVFKDESFMKDRSGYFGREWTAEGQAKGRPEALVHVRQLFDILESMFADDRQWIAGTESPTLADLEGTTKQPRVGH